MIPTTNTSWLKWVLFTVGDRQMTMMSVGEDDENTWQHWKSVRSHFGVKWHLLELLNQNGQTTQALAYATCAQHNSTKVQTLSGPSNTCWVQSLQRMPWPHTKLLLWLSWTQLNKYTTVTSFTNYWLYNGVKVAMWFVEVTLDKTQQHMLYTYCV